MLDVEGFILVGGASSRMGTDKSRLILGGETSVARIAAAMQAITNQIRVVGARDSFHEFANIADLHETWGPLGGIHAALRAASAEWCFVVACDLPFVTAGLLTRLLHLGMNASSPTDAVVPIQEDNYPQPLCAIYRRLPCLAGANQSISNAEYSPRALLDKVNARFVSFTEIQDLPGSQNFFFNINTPENYTRARQLFEQEG